MSMEIHQTSLTACAGDQLTRKAMCEQMNFSDSQSKHKLHQSHLKISQPIYGVLFNTDSATHGLSHSCAGTRMCLCA